mmetsp:Transcript_6271/g.23574  ORF Transcript_6271/g.23574 Transcript_6271/m.23574 type:complete len:82 (-) Transcript_6271:346-591(-)
MSDCSSATPFMFDYITGRDVVLNKLAKSQHFKALLGMNPGIFSKALSSVRHLLFPLLQTYHCSLRNMFLTYVLKLAATTQL